MTKQEPFYADPIIAAALAKPDTAYLDRLRAYNETLRAQRAVIFDRPPCTCPDWAEGYGAGGKHGRFCDSLSQPYEPAYDEDEGLNLVEIDLVAMDAYLAGADRDVNVDWEAA